MKKNYLKPDVEFISFCADESITDILDGNTGIASGEVPDDE